MPRSLSRSAIAAFALLSLTLAPLAARADAVPPPPANCIPGTTGMTCHGGPWCQPDTCKTSADCTAGQVCEPRSFCLGQVVCYGGIVVDGGVQQTPEPAAGAACATTADCDGGATCATESLCVTPGSTGAGGGSIGDVVVHSGCSCEAAGGGGGPVVLSLAATIAGAAGALARWRRRQRASAQRRA